MTMWTDTMQNVNLDRPNVQHEINICKQIIKEWVKNEIINAWSNCTGKKKKKSQTGEEIKSELGFSLWEKEGNDLLMDKGNG